MQIAVPVTIMRNWAPVGVKPVQAEQYQDSNVDISFDAFGQVWLHWHRPSGTEYFIIKGNDLVHAVMRFSVADTLVHISELEEREK